MSNGNENKNVIEKDLSYINCFFRWVKLEKKLENNLPINLMATFYIRLFYSIINKKREEIGKIYPFFCNSTESSEISFCNSTKSNEIIYYSDLHEALPKLLEDNPFFTTIKQNDKKYIVMFAASKYENRHPEFCVFEVNTDEKYPPLKLVQIKTEKEHRIGQDVIGDLENLPKIRVEVEANEFDPSKLYIKETHSIERLSINDKHCFMDHYDKRIRPMAKRLIQELKIKDYDEYENNAKNNTKFINLLKKDIKETIIDTLHNSPKYFNEIYIDNMGADKEGYQYPEITTAFFLQVKYLGWEFYPLIVSQKDRYQIITFYTQNMYKNNLKAQNGDI